MSKNEKRSPELRFKGFSDAWEQRKLRDVTNKIGSGKTPKGGSAVYQASGIPFLRSQNIKNNSVNFDEIVYITETTNNEMINSLVFQNDVLLNITGASIGRSAVYKHTEPANVNQHVCIIRPNQMVNPYFIQLNLTSHKGQKQIDDNQAGGGREGLNFKQIGKMRFYYPTFSEQNKIGEFFNCLDKVINLHQRKVEALQYIKEGLLQQLFPNTDNGSLSLYYPEHQNIWKSLKLDNIAERVRGNDGRMDLPTLTISASKGWLNQEDRFSQNIAGKEQKNYTLLKKGMLSYNKGNSKIAPYGIAYKLEDYEEALVPGVYHSFTVKENASEDFIEYLFTSRKVDKELAKIITSGARMDGLLNINYLDFSSISILLPQLEEQKSIAKTLRQIDKIIELSNKKIEKLKSLKMTYLKKMFI